MSVRTGTATLASLGLALLLAASAACNQRSGAATPASETATMPAPTPAEAADDYSAKVRAFRLKHEEDYTRDWVSIAGLHFLTPGIHTIGRAPSNDIPIVANLPEEAGRLRVRAGHISFEPAPGVVITRKAEPLTTGAGSNAVNTTGPGSGSVVMKEPGRPPAPEIMIGSVRLVAHVSGERLALRVRDPEGPLARDFRGFRWFAIDPQARVVARFTRDAEPRKMTVQNTLGDADSYASEGVLEFALHGQTLRLRPFTSRPNRFYIVFRDASAGQETYETARFLYADLQEDGTAVLDFNEAYNPPCSFNPYTTCPIPLKENILPVKVLAGERAYPIHVSVPDAAR